MKTSLFSCLLAILISHIGANWITGNLCWSMPCMNGGSCFGSNQAFLCICPIDFTGSFCEKRLGRCQENPCQNRGLCIETSLTTYECRCYFDYIGRNCDERITKTNHSIWSSLLPAHTKILFDMLHDAYRAKAKEKSYIVSENGDFDLSNLLVTTENPITASEIQFENITTEEEIELTSTSSIEWFNETESTSITTTPITTDSPEIHRKQLLKKLCKKLFSHILSNTSSTSSDSTQILLSWFNKHLPTSTSTSTSTTATTTSFVIKPNTRPLASLKRINTNDDFHLFDNEH